jgi:hypothetical protein
MIICICSVVHRFAEISVREVEPDPFCVEKKKTDREVGNGTFVKVKHTYAEKMENPYYDPDFEEEIRDLNRRRKQKDYEAQNKVKQKLLAEALKTIPVVHYHPDSIVIKRATDNIEVSNDTGTLHTEHIEHHQKSNSTNSPSRSSVASKHKTNLSAYNVPKKNNVNTTITVKSISTTKESNVKEKVDSDLFDHMIGSYANSEYKEDQDEEDKIRELLDEDESNVNNDSMENSDNHVHRADVHDEYVSYNPPGNVNDNGLEEYNENDLVNESEKEYLPPVETYEEVHDGGFEDGEDSWNDGLPNGDVNMDESEEYDGESHMRMDD